MAEMHIEITGKGFRASLTAAGTEDGMTELAAGILAAAQQHDPAARITAVEPEPDA